jgi:phosphoglycolate phosphatase-like HAD superfamily hydrolase
LINLSPHHGAFVGIDSDGCVFPTMEIKQKKCLHNLIISHWHLEKIEKYVRESAEFVNLYSIHRGRNRFPCLLRSIDLLRSRPEVIASKVKLPEFKSFKIFIDSGVPLSNAELEKAARSSGDRELAEVLQWSKDANELIARTVKNIPPFKWVRDSLEIIGKNADAICVSQTPAEALMREWDEHGLRDFIRVIAGQELGTKEEHIRLATAGRYASDKILMIGDAPGDLEAAKGNHAHFYPINPGHEPDSWERFYKEAFLKFLEGKYRGCYENELIREFNSFLPSVPPWQSSAPETLKTARKIKH